MVGFCGEGVLFLVTCMVLVIEYSCVEYSCDPAFTVRYFCKCSVFGVRHEGVQNAVVRHGGFNTCVRHFQITVCAIHCSVIDFPDRRLVFGMEALVCLI